MLLYGYQKVYIVVNVTINMVHKKRPKRLGKTDMYELNEAYQKMLMWFFSFPDRKIGLNDLSEELEIAKTTAKRVVTRLVDEGFLKTETVGRAWRIYNIKSHQYNFTRKVSYNLQMVYESGIIEEIHKSIPNSRALILFGSYRKGDDTDKSDIDIAVEVLGNEDMKIYERVLPQFGYRINVTVNLHVFTRNKIDLNLFSNIANGIVLEGFLEVRP